MLTLLNKITKNWGVILLSSILILIFCVNYPYGKWLLGWDALNPELNISLNLKYAFFSAWQPHYGTGAMIGHGYAATLPHVLITGFLSLLLPIESIRPVFILLCWYIGAIGMYYFMLFLFKKFKDPRNAISNTQQLLAISSALFYSFNLGTTQIFYHPLEAFTVQFALLPWFFLIIEEYLFTENKKKLFTLFIVSFLGSIQGFIPVNFVALLIIFGCYSLVHILIDWRKKISKLLFVSITVFLANSYWLFPFTFYTFTNTDTFLNAHQNTITTPNFIAKTSQYGTLENVIGLKSLFLEGKLFDEFVFEPWIHFSNNLAIGSVYIIIFILSILSLLFFIVKWNQNRHLLPYVIPFVFSFGTLATQVPFFKTVNSFLYSISPLYEQAFRTAFTKIGISYFFLLTLFSFVLIYKLLLSEKLRNIRFYISFFVLLIIFIITIPHFKGNSFYSRLKLTIPNAYFELFQYFRKEPNDGYIAEIPLTCNDGWYSYDWGYTGSGFYWYSIEQSFLSRAFDVWNPYTEKYYWELERALREGNFDSVNRIFDKYFVNWVIFDDSQQHCRNKNAFAYTDQLYKYFSNNYELVFQENIDNGKTLTVFKRPTYYQQKLSLDEKLPVIKTPFIDLDKDYIFEINQAYLEKVNLDSEKIPKSNKKNVSEFISIDIDNQKIISQHPGSFSIQSDVAVFETDDLLEPTPCSGGKSSYYQAVINEFGKNNSVYLTSTTDDCIYFYADALDFKSGGIISFNAHNFEGLPLKLIIQDDLSKQYIEQFIDNGENTFIIPPANSNASRIDFTLLNKGYENKTSINRIGTLTLLQLDVPMLEKMFIPYTEELIDAETILVNKEKTFIVGKDSSQYLILFPTSYNQDWLLVAKEKNSPWWSFERVEFDNHFKLNSWGNAWLVSNIDQKVLYVVFWPQLISMVGYGLLMCGFVFVVLCYKISSNKKMNTDQTVFPKTPQSLKEKIKKQLGG